MSLRTTGGHSRAEGRQRCGRDVVAAMPGGAADSTGDHRGLVRHAQEPQRIRSSQVRGEGPAVFTGSCPISGEEHRLHCQAIMVQSEWEQDLKVIACCVMPRIPPDRAVRRF